MARFHRPRVLWRWTESITCFFKPRHLTKSHAKQFEQSIASQRSATAKRSKNQKFCSLILLFASAYQSSLVSCLALGSTLKDSNSDLSDELTSSKLMGAYRAKSHPHLFLVSSSHTSQRQSEAPTEAEYMKYMSLNVCLEVFLDLQDWMLDAVTKVAAFHLWSHVCPNHLPGGIMPIIGGIPWKQSENENKTLQGVHNLARAPTICLMCPCYTVPVRNSLTNLPGTTHRPTNWLVQLEPFEHDSMGRTQAMAPLQITPSHLHCMPAFDTL